MPKTNPDKPMCKRCAERNSVSAFKGLCSKCYNDDLNNTPSIDLSKLSLGSARSEEDWKKIYAQVEPIALEIAAGKVKASAAQAAIIKEIFSRAHGKVSKSQSERAAPVGVVVLPTLGIEKGVEICSICIQEHAKHSTQLGAIETSA